MIDTIGIFKLRTFFGESNVEIEPETVEIYNDEGVLETMSFLVAYRHVYRQTMGKYASWIRVFLLDPLTDWCLTPAERRVRHNQNVIKDFLRYKVAQHGIWRKKNPIQEDMIVLCDLYLLDKKKFSDEETVLENLVSAIFGFSMITIGSVCQTFYQVMSHEKA